MRAETIVGISDVVHSKDPQTVKVLMTALKKPPMCGLKEPLSSGKIMGLGGHSN